MEMDKTGHYIYNGIRQGFETKGDRVHYSNDGFKFACGIQYRSSPDNTEDWTKVTCELCLRGNYFLKHPFSL